jgi:hypothetical protein
MDSAAAGASATIAMIDTWDMALLLILLQIAQVQLMTLQARLCCCLDEIEKAMLLHNFIIDEREAKGFHEEDASFFRKFSLREQDSRRNESA